MDESPVHIIKTDPSLSGLSSEVFQFPTGRSPLAIAFISPHLDFTELTSQLLRLAGNTPLVAMSTAGELCSVNQGDQLYCPTGHSWSTVVVEVFSPSLINAVSIHAIPLPNEDIRRGTPSVPWDERVSKITESLASVRPSFPLSVRDSFALTFIDGLSACEGQFMEAVYASGRFPVLFVGGSAGGRLDYEHTYLFDGSRIIENHAVVIFVKVATGMAYSVLKSHNFRKTGVSFIVVDADPDRRTVSHVQDSKSGQIFPLVDYLTMLLDVTPGELHNKLTGYSFGIDLEKEVYIRSAKFIELDRKEISFYCDINPGDELFLLEADDFVETTRRDLDDFMRGKPRPVAAILNDCIRRRLDNAPDLDGLSSLWPFPVAGFSTFGEIFGININQTLTAVVFFEDRDGRFRDDFLDNFPALYAGFAQTRLRRLMILNRLLVRAADTMNKMTVGELPLKPLLGKYPDEIGYLANAFHRLMEKLLNNQKEMAQIIEFLPDPAFVIDQDQRVVFWNKAMEQLTGLNKADIIGRGDYSYAVPFYGGRRPMLIDAIFIPAAAIEAQYDHVNHVEDTVYAESYIPHMNRNTGAYLWGAAAPLFNSEGRPIGAIEVIRDITMHRRAEQALEKSLEEKNVLFRELQHRVKNNLNIIASLLNLSINDSTDDHSIKIIKDTVSRIHTISEIYTQLNDTGDLQEVDLDDYIKKMTLSLVDTLTVGKKRIDVHITLDAIRLDVKRAVPLGLILNESITNTVKYAYPDESMGALNVELVKKGENITLTVSDDGIGLPEAVKKGTSRGMGLQLMEMLTRQIKGDLSIDSGIGTSIRVTFRE
ncbi:MAG TPA: FIST N-terminal domain-containing protein [Spirochaetota bacterium]|nr:FIST N-terminal domain-containing protein [Spirochaetota bacterium]HPC43328.1 FIST N-terminal domain-containing protein [Spirochaetota bacterium]HQF10193.1 FIST N-terminal domain-containing protein [Spirochaetota bacterium]HQH99384.1 FIST N-terminal domain-containing protein [Spirochaetota bacterium]HQJ73217.1 FIST N-terminal domain-containing protein [Spirochaetota bacterium]